MKLLLLCDYGLDDAVATEYLLGAARNFSGVDVVPVGGNVPQAVALRNANTLLAHSRADLAQVRLVDTSTLPQPEEMLADIHGRDGMGDLWAPAPAPVPTVPYEDWLGELTPADALLSLGPCTVTLDILRRTGPHPLTIMGGNVRETPNFRGREFNHALDVPAFAACVRYPHRVATLDTCRHPDFNRTCAPLPETGVLKELVERSIALAARRHEDRCYIYDHVAAQAVVHPERFTTRQETDPDGNLLTVLYRN